MVHHTSILMRSQKRYVEVVIMKLKEISKGEIKMVVESNKVKIVLTRRWDDYHACIEGHPEIWGCGSTYNEAVGNLVRFHKEYFTIKGHSEIWGGSISDKVVGSMIRSNEEDFNIEIIYSNQ